jgi:plasmid stabilization system protein ParE
MLGHISRLRLMKNNIKFSPFALNDLDEIWDYISINLSNPTAAKRTVDGIMDAVDTLKDFSRVGSILEFSNGIKSNYRFVKHKNYMVFYRINSNDIFIDRIIYAKRDYLKILFKDE